ncbi:MAG: InlB B-repeat-containing protein, partial [Clostridia bacterium]|nr:InlB B-repeat-containing protein [Clostridia bacterium]
NDEVKHAESFTLHAASKTNYTFMGWFYGPVSSRIQVTEIPFSYQGSIVYENLTLVAQFVRTSDSYREVTFYDGERLLYSLSIYAGNRISNEPADIQNKISEMSRLEKTGYVNTGKWYTDIYFRNEFSFDTPINLDTILYLKYNLINYWITYSYKVEDGNYGVYSNISASGVVNFNPVQYNVENDILLDSVSLAGYRFIGWFHDNEPIERISYQSDGHMGNIQIVGKFEYITYNILYSIEPGYKNNSANPTGYKIDDDIIVLQDAVAVAGYHFVKWVLTTDVNTQITQIEPRTMQNYYITAVFEQDKKYVYIELYTDGVKFSEIQNEENTLLTSPTRTREGYLLDGWYIDAEYTTKYDFSTPTTENGKLYSRFVAEEYYITYAANIVLSSSNTFPEYSSYFITDSIQIPGMQNETGYTFVGWYTGAEFIDGEYNFDNAVAFNGVIVNRTGDIDLVARFRENIYDIIYKLDGGTNNEHNPTTITYNSPIIVLRNPEKAGYTFVGWTRETADGDEPITMIPSLSTENYIIKANFTKKKESIVVQRRVWRGGMLYSLPEQTIQLNSSGKAFINNVIPTEQGYIFDTWYSDKDCTSYFNLNTQYSDDVIMYGRFMPVQYAITYLYNVGDTQTPTNPTSFAYNGYPFVLKDPSVLAGYKFDAWYTGVEITETGYNFANATRVTSIGDTPGDVEIVAKYDVVTYRINYYLDIEGAENNPSNPTSFTVLDNGMKLYNAIAPEGYKFLGWFDAYDREVTEISTNMSSDLDITGKFEKEEQPVQVNTNKLYYILIAIGGIGIFFTSIIVVIVLNGNKRKALDEKRISSLLQQINDVVNKRDK